jgi:hypothetical protein
MKRVYVAGPYSADNVITVLDNIREGQRMATRVLLAGYAPFCPFIDFHFSLMLREGEKLDVNDYYEYSNAWLEVSDAMLVLPGYERSKGTKAEIKIAKKFSIPIYFDFKDLIKNEESWI